MAKAGHLYDAFYASSTMSEAVGVKVRFEARGLVIEHAGIEHAGGERETWPYAGIVTRSPGSLNTASPHTASQIVLSSETHAGATLSVTNAEFIRSIVQAAPGLRRTPVGPSWMPMVVASLAVVALIGGLIWGLVGLFPYKAVARRIPDDTRIKIGELALADILREHKPCENAAGKAALGLLVDRLAKASGTNIKFKVQVIDWKLLNAFTVMGNQIVLTNEILRVASSPDEVAGVLGHEMGHAIELHAEAGALRALGTALGVQVFLGGWTPDIAAQAASQLLLLQHGRANELEADDVALGLLEAAKISAAPFAGFFEKLSKEEDKQAGKGLKIPDVFSTHPPSPERARRVKAKASYPATPALEPGDWAALKKICS